VATTSVKDALIACRPLLATGDTMIVCDFDGTLARLVLDPWAARILPTAQRALRQLSRTPGVGVVFLSGRSVTDLARRARVGGATYLGDHGAERAEAVRGFRPAALRVSREPAAPGEAEMAARLVAEVPARIKADWLVVEQKGTSVALHFRSAPDVSEARTLVRDSVESIDDDGVLVRHQGMRVLELRSRSASTKGTAMAALMDERRPRSILSLGDDRNDALAFDVVRAAREQGRLKGLAIAVAGHADVTSDVAPRADLTLASPLHTARFLAGLADGVGSRGQGG
jgi:trehalose-phosphatase